VIAVPLRLRFGLEDRENNELAPTINLASTALAGQIQEDTEDCFLGGGEDCNGAPVL